MKKVCNISFCILILLNTHVLFAQESINQIIEKRIESIIETSEDAIEETELYDQLLELANNPLNLNCKNFDILLRLGLMNEFQLYQLQNYLNQVERMHSILELKFIEGFSEKNIEELKYFVSVSQCKETSFKLLKPRHEMTTGYSRVLQKQSGYQIIDNEAFIDSPNKVYLGSPEKIYSRYKLKSGDNLQAGFITEKDAGEVLFKNHHKELSQNLLTKNPQSFDYVTAFASIETIGFLKNFIVGDYQLQFGQGLTMWSSLAFGKSTATTELKKYARGISPNTSSNENHFFRGIAGSFQFKNIELSLFYSNKKRDGNLISDTAFSSLQNTGLHRTINEIEDKNSISEKIMGGNINVTIKQIKIGFTAYHQSFDKNQIIDDQTYKRYNFSGDENFCYGMDYQSNFKKLELFGEISISKNHSKAIFSGLNYYLNSQAKIHIHYRNYSRAFQNFYASGLSENSTTKNEEGFYTGINLDLHPKWSLSAYTDFFRFPWLKSGIGSPSQGNEQLIQINYKHSQNLTVYGRYKRQKKEASHIEADIWFDYLVPEIKESIRLHLELQLSSVFKLQSRAEWQFYTIDKEKSDGFLIFQEISYNSTNSRLNGSFRYINFNTKDYDSRIYTYEKDVRYTFSIPSFYGKGNRFYLMLAYQFSDGIIARLKYSQTNYLDRETIGSGLDLIEGSTKSELRFQLQIKF